MPWEQTDNEIRHRLADPGGFEQDSFRRKNIDAGVDLILGKKQGSDSMEAQALRFDKSKFDLSQAKDWFQKHWEKKKDMSFDSYSIPGVEIFSVGKWNGDEYSEQDLNEMVMAFEENKTGARPHLKLGHDKNQKLLQADGLPAAGWVNKLYVQNGKLLADFVDIPKKIYDLIKSKAYRKVSSEIFWNISIGKKTYKRMLAAVALLGSDMPGVMNLSDIIALYDLNKESFDQIKTYDFDFNENEKGVSMSEKEQALEQELKAQKELVEKLETEKKEYTLKQEQEIAELKEYKQKIEAEKEQLRIEKFVTELKAEKLCSPAMEEMVKELAGPEKKEYTANKLNKEQTIKELLKLSKSISDVNFDENSSKDYEKMSKEDQMDKKAKAYMQEHKCSYGKAIKAVMKEKQ